MSQKKQVESLNETRFEPELEGEHTQEPQIKVEQGHDGEMVHDPEAAHKQEVESVEGPEQEVENVRQPEVQIVTVFWCDSCNKTFNNKNKLDEHKVSVHGESKNAYLPLLFVWRVICFRERSR